MNNDTVTKAVSDTWGTLDLPHLMGNLVLVDDSPVLFLPVKAVVA